MTDWTDAKKVEVYLVDATSTWDSTTTHIEAVPAGKRWKITSITMKNDASQTATFYYTRADNVIIAELANQGANVGRTTWPTLDSATRLGGNELIMDPGEELSFVAGGAQGAGAYILIQALEVAV